MSESYEEQIRELRRQAAWLPYGQARTALLEEAVRLADTHLRVDLGFAVRKDLILAATFGGNPEKALVHFTWRLAQSDREPERFPEKDLLWEYKWILESVADFPQIERQQIDEMFADIIRRYQRAGYNMRAVHKLQGAVARAVGDRGEAWRTFALWHRTPRDSSSDCAACDQHYKVTQMVFRGKHERAVGLARPILRGRMACSVIPHHTFAWVLYPFVRLGRLEEAMAAHVAGYRLVRENPKFLGRVGHHLQFLVWTNNLARAVQLFEKHLPWALQSANPRDSLLFYLDARFLFEQLEAAGQSSLKLHLPHSFPAYQETGDYETAALCGWLDEACRGLAERFDARDGNDYYARLLKRAGKWKKWVRPFALPGSR
jgi:hypothetical protein